MAKPKLALIPAAQGSKFYSVLPSSGVGDFTFSRSGSATRINSQGLIETVADGVSRLNYPLIDGKVVGCPHHLLEPQRTNLITYSEDFSQSDWSAFDVSKSANSVLSPDGTLNGARITALSGTNKAFQQLVTVSSDPSNDRVFTGSIYIKSSSVTSCFLRVGSATSNNAITISNEWQRFEAQYTLAATFTAVRLGIVLNNEGDEVDVAFGQVELANYPTSYIPTNGSTVTRSAETANGSGDVDTFNDSEGVFFLEAKTNQPNFFQSISIKDSIGNGLTFKFRNDNASIWARYKTSTEQKDIYYYNNVNDNYNKLAILYGNGSIGFYINGFLIGSNTITTNFSNLNEIIFKDVNLSEIFYGNTKQLQYFDSALTDSELETLTSWVSFSDMANGQLYTIQ